MADAGSIGIAPLRFECAWNLRGDPAQPRFIAAAHELLGPVPPSANTSAHASGRLTLWLGPKSWLCLGDDAHGEFAHGRKAINAAGGALFDVSASQVAWHITGNRIERVLGRLCPLDLHLRAFAVGTCGQSLLGHINALYYRTGSLGFAVFAARSLARDALHQLHAAATSERYEMRDGAALAAILPP